METNIKVCPFRLIGVSNKDYIQTLVNYACLKENCALFIKESKEESEKNLLIENVKVRIIAGHCTLNNKPEIILKI